MQPCNREMPGMNNNSLNPSSQISLQELQQQRNSQSQINQHQIQSSHFESPMSHDYFLEQMLTNLGSGPSSWAEQLNSSNKSPWDTSIPINGLSHHHNSNNNDNNQPRDLSYETVPYDHENVAFPYDESSNLASKFREHQINGGSKSSAAAADALMLHQQLVMSRGIGGDSEHGVISMPLSLNRNGDFDRSQNDVVDGSSFKSPSRGSDGAVQSLNNGFGISLHGASQVSLTQTEHFHHPKGNSMQAQSYRGPGATTNQAQPPATGSLSGATKPSQTRPRVRARRGQATDPHSIAERLRRERIAERMKALQELVPNANKTDKASMLDEIIDYVKFLQVQVKVLSMSRLGGAAAVAPYLGADMSSKGGGDCIQTNGNGGTKSSNNQAASLSNNNESMTVTEHQVAKLMEDDMGSAMQYLQGKGLCLMPIYLATAISTATCHARSSMINNSVMHSHGEGPSSPSISGLTVQSATLVNGGPESSVKDYVSVSQP